MLAKRGIIDGHAFEGLVLLLVMIGWLSEEVAFILPVVIFKQMSIFRSHCFLYS